MPILPDSPSDADYRPARSQTADSHEQMANDAFRAWLLTKDYRIDASADGLKTFGSFDYVADTMRLSLAADVAAELAATPDGRIVWGSAGLYEFTPYVTEKYRAGRMQKLTARFKVEVV